jgi:hypothetical protein
MNKHRSKSIHSLSLTPVIHTEAALSQKSWQVHTDNAALVLGTQTIAAFVQGVEMHHIHIIVGAMAAKAIVFTAAHQTQRFYVECSTSTCDCPYVVPLADIKCHNEG